MKWLNKLGKLEPGEDRRSSEGDADIEPPRRDGGTVVRALPGASIRKSGNRFEPNQQVTVDLQIMRLLGGGGMGDVYLARQRLWDMDVALKIPTDEVLLDSENRHRIIREAEAWTDLGLHPNIAYCYYAETVDELLFLVIEYVDGGNLRDWIADGRCADLSTGLDLAIQFCHGLKHAHNKGLVHRDIKPENILMMNEGALKITDFGTVRKTIASQETPEPIGLAEPAPGGVTIAGIGTANYMAPEQWGDQSGIDIRADIFAFGICLYEMLCGARPYQMTTGQRQEAPEPEGIRGGRTLPERLRCLMKRCVDWDRDARPAGAGEVLTELCVAYEEMFGEPCLHAALPELSTMADASNNRALSYLALRRTADAEKAWQTALEVDPSHAESTYNYGLLRWRQAKATDVEILANMRMVAEGDASSWLPRYLVAQLHVERGDREGAREELAKIDGDGASGVDVATARRAMDALPAPSGLARTLEGHTSYVHSICLSADERYALSGGWDKTLKLWEVDKGTCVRTFEGHSDYVDSVCLSADGRYALSGSKDKTLKLWEVGSGRCVRTFEGHTGWVMSVCLSADGRYALSGNGDKTLKLWDAESGRCLRTFQGHGDWVMSVCLSADGRIALSGDGDSGIGGSGKGRWTLKLWEVESGRCLRTFEGHTDSVICVCLSADGQYALSGSADKTLRLWEVESGRCLRIFQGHTGWVESVCMGADGQYVLSGSDDKTLKLWEVESGRCLRTFEGHSKKVMAVCLNANGQIALSGSNDGTVKMWRIGSFLHHVSFRFARLTPSVEAIAAGARYAAALSEARSASYTGDAVRACRCIRQARQELRFRRAADAIREWSALYGRLLRRGLTDCWLLWRAIEATNHVCLSKNGQYALSCRSFSLKLLEVAGGHCLRSFREEHVAFITSLCLSADSRFALAGIVDDTLKLWDVESGRWLRTFQGHTGWVFSVCLSADGRHAVSGSKDKTLKLWDVETGHCLRTFQGHTGYVSSTSLSADGRCALSGSGDKTLKLWDVASGRCLRTFHGHTDLVVSVCLSVDGRYALSGSEDRTVKLWETESGRCLRTFQGHSRRVKSVCLSADGRFALSGSDDKALKLWDVESGRCLRTLEHESGVTFAGLSQDARHIISTCDNGTLTAWFVDWDLEDNEPAGWDERARPYLEIFLCAHRPCGPALPRNLEPTDEEVTRALTRQGRPVWLENDFENLLFTLGCAGYGWLRPEGVRRELELMAAQWSAPQ